MASRSRRLGQRWLGLVIENNSVVLENTVEGCSILLNRYFYLIEKGNFVNQKFFGNL